MKIFMYIFLSTLALTSAVPQSTIDDLELPAHIVKWLDCNTHEDNLEAELEHFTYSKGGRIAKVMAVADVMEKIDAANEMLNKVMKMSVLTNRDAITMEIITQNWFTKALKTIGSGIKSAGDFINKTAKKVICN